MRKTLSRTRGLAVALVIAGAIARSSNATESIYQPAETLPAQKHDKVFDVSGFDRVNLFSGDLQLTIPIGPEYPVTAGFTFQLSANYSSKFWHMVRPECGPSELGCGNEWAGRANVIGDPALGVGWSIGGGYVEEWIPPGNGLPRRWLQTANGTRQDFGVALEASDGSDVRLIELANGYVVRTPDGTQWHYTTPQTPPASSNEYDFRNVNPGEGGVLTRWGLTSVTDRYGNENVLTVEYMEGGDWRVKEIVLAGDRKITFSWGTWNGASGEIWPVLSSVSLPKVGGGTLTASFSWTAAAPIMRVFEGGVVQGCTVMGPSYPVLPMLGTVSISDQNWTFAYDQGTSGKGTLRRVTIPTGGTVDYEYGTTPGYPCVRNDSTCLDPEELVVPLPPLTPPPAEPESNQPMCEKVWRAQFVEISPAVEKRTESDGTVVSERVYKRRSMAEKEDGHPANEPPRPDFLRAVRVVVVGEPDGNGGRRSRRHVFRVDGGQEVLQRIYANGEGTGTPERTIVSCWGMWTDTFGTCGTFERVEGTKKISEWSGGVGRLMRTVTWYGANPSYEQSTEPTAPMTFTAGASCTDFLGRVCLQKTASGWNEPAREYSIWTTEKQANSGSLFPTDFVKRVETTEWNADEARWDLKRPGSKSVKDEYNDGGTTCPERHAPCETKTSYEYAVNGFLTKATLGDVDSGVWKLETVYEQDGTSGNVKIERKTVKKNGTAQLDLGYAIGRSYQYGQVVQSRWLKADDTELLKRFDVTRDGNTGWITISRDPAGLETTYEYDGLGRLTSVTAPGETDTETYCHAVNPPGLKPYVLVKKGSTNACGLTESGTGPYEAYQYDRLGRLERKIRRYPDAAVSGTGMKFGVQQRRYALSGDVTFVSEWTDCGTGTETTPGGTDASACFTTTPTSGTSYSEFDALGRVRREVTADGYRVKREYGPTAAISESDMLEWRERSATAGPQRYTVSARRVNALGQLTIVVEPAFVAGEETVVLGPHSFLYYNALGKLSQAQDDGKASSAPATSMPEAADAYIQKRTWLYDASGLLRRETHPEKTGAVEYLAYDALGNVSEKTDGGIWSGYEYDRAGRLTREKASTGGTAAGAVPVVANGWDTAMTGRLAERRGWNPSGEARYEQSAAYWPADPAMAPPGLTMVERFTYGATSGKLSSRTVSPQMEAGTSYRENGIGVTETFTYDGSGNLTEYRHPANGSWMGLSQTRSYKAGMQTGASVKTTEMASPVPSVTSVSYGPSGALKSYTLGNGSVVQISMDARSRPALISGGEFNSGVMTYDGDGNISKAGTRTYGYDEGSRLTSVKDPGPRGTTLIR
ncbi:MAG: hypothetical protein L6R30_12260, partial [Thermoanaerobaculia bacterium]|nr:hypothetical protein [Thermoanaerobaculia bacterium]